MPVPVLGLLEELRHSPLLDAEQKATLTGLDGQFPKRHDLAQELVRRGWLTLYQASLLLQGQGEQLLLGQYILLDKVGEGGMGQVYKARQRNLDRVVALKVIRKECLDNPRVISRFRREMQAVGQLSHPNIVRAYDADQVNGSYYMAMEFIDGMDLAGLVRTQGPLAVDWACELIRQAALGLQHAHERGFVHRDIKPGNLLVANIRSQESGVRGQESGVRTLVFGRARKAEKSRNSGERNLRGLRKIVAEHDARTLTPDSGFLPPVVKLLDLGLARWEDPAGGRASTHLTQMGSVMGTPDFIAPEQARNSHTCDIRADLYSLGCTLYYLIAGRVPFAGGSFAEKLLQHQMDAPEPLAQVRRTMLVNFHARQGATRLPRRLLHVPESVAGIIAKLMAKRPEDRFQTPAELAQALEQALEERAPAPAPEQKPNDAADCETISPMPMIMDTHAMDGPLVKVASVLGLKRPRPWSRRRWISVGSVGMAILLGLVLAILNGNHAKPQAGDVKVSPAVDDSGPWQILQAEVGDQKLPAEELRARLYDFARRHPTRAPDVAALLQQVPSPLDRLDRTKIDVKQWYAWMPDELVGILGMWRGFQLGRNSHGVAASADGKWIVASAEDRFIRVWDTSAPTVPWRIENQSWARVSRVATAPRGDLLAAACEDGTARIYSLKNRALLHALETPPKRALSCVAFHPDGALLATAGHDGVVRLWNVAGAAAPAPIEIQTNTDQIHSLAFAPDGKYVFWGGKNQEVHWADLVGQCAAHWKFAVDGGAVKTLAFHPDGRTLVCGGGDGTLRFCTWDGQQIKAQITLAKHGSTVNAAAFAFDGASFVTVGDDKLAILWDAVTGEVKRTWELRFPIQSVAYAPDSRHILLANANSTIYVLRISATPDLAGAK